MGASPSYHICQKGLQNETKKITVIPSTEHSFPTHSFLIHEIPIHYDIRIGRSKLGSIGDGIRIAMKIIRRKFVKKPVS